MFALTKTSREKITRVQKKIRKTTRTSDILRFFKADAVSKACSLYDYSMNTSSVLSTKIEERIVIEQNRLFPK